MGIAARCVGGAIRLAELNTFCSKLIRFFGSTDGAADTTGCDTQARLDEPVFGHFVALANLT